MNPGDLNRRLVLEEPVETADGTGGVTRSHQAVATLWAKVETVSARAAIVADSAGANVTHRITLRTRPDVTTRHRLTAGARVYRIVSVRDDAARRFLTITAELRGE